MQRQLPTETAKAPEWALNPFEEGLSNLERMNQLLELSIRGISALRAMPQVVSAIAKATGETSTESHQSELAWTTKLAELAKREVEEGFPLLHAQTLVALWGSLEALIITFLVCWLQNEPQAMQTEGIQNLSIKLGEYESLQGEERAIYIIELLEREMKAPFKAGVNRFESLLEVFGLSGYVDESDKKNLYEMSQLRNVLVHRRGIADKHLIDACPWLDLETGQPVLVTFESYQRFSASVVHYIIELVARVGTYFGMDDSDFDEFRNRRNN
jgi:hypothetical protein